LGIPRRSSKSDEHDRRVEEALESQRRSFGMDVDVGRISPKDYREHSRRNFLKTAAAVTAALAAAGFGGVQFATREADAQVGGEYTTYLGLGDAAILQLAYQLELLEGTFYAVGRDSGLFRGPALAQIAELSAHEFAHADAIAGALGSLGAAIPQPALTLPPTPDAATFLGLAATLEPVGIGAYQGAAPAIQDKGLLPTALSIHNAECQHWCAIKILQGVVPPNNVALEQALPLGAVVEAAAPFGVRP
jgi:hypothetical protein